MGRKSPKKKLNTVVQNYKIVVFGEIGVGRSAIMSQFVNSFIFTHYEIHDPDDYTKHCVIDDVEAKLDIMKANYSFTALTEQYMRSGDCFLLVFSVTDRNSLEKLVSFHELILRVKERDKFPMLMVANKIDLEQERVISTEEGHTLAHQLKIPYIECSAKNNTNIDQAFYELVRLVRQFQAAESAPAKNKRFCVIF